MGELKDSLGSEEEWDEDDEDEDVEVAIVEIFQNGSK